ncbi:leucyl aminopeptidase (aminopeptidase T) [Anaerospora hongkongensis]|uniref:Leucyl aminopeptidase (Aminopeptidase T) n=1 Tax=Anaerospora hongkongensis TaxID=244830 RepID=A0A4R1PU04_9FIRM|nr:aminopeptidase [Anaerospora hongkongensis]TCL31415.1 leucyl aminopeptidase (aminopeptidase T) [Anaerospora hongkongensis]
MTANLGKSADIAIRQCMAVKPGETVLVVTDLPTRSVGQALWEKAVEAGAEALYMEMVPRKNDGAEPPAAIAAAMLQADVVLGATSRSFSHTQARKAASKKGVRMATLPGITEDIMQRTLNADYERIATVSTLFAGLLSKGSHVHISTPAGTDLTLSIAGRAGHPDTGINHEAGDFSNLPAGEAYVAPVEGTTEGVFVIDGAMAGIGVLETPIKLTVEKGYVSKIEGGQEGQQLEATLDEYGKEARNIAELGIGTNDQAILSGRVLEDEKVMGTVHIALGNNVGFGGTCQIPLHLDGILLNPTLTIDGQVVIKDGKHVITA